MEHEDEAMEKSLTAKLLAKQHECEDLQNRLSALELVLADGNGQAVKLLSALQEIASIVRLPVGESITNSVEAVRQLVAGKAYPVVPVIQPTTTRIGPRETTTSLADFVTTTVPPVAPPTVVVDTPELWALLNERDEGAMDDAHAEELEQAIVAHITALIEAARVEGRADALDAKRYRKIRSMHWDDSNLTVTHPKNVCVGAVTYSEERLDAAIDAAIKAGGK